MSRLFRQLVPAIQETHTYLVAELTTNRYPSDAHTAQLTVDIALSVGSAY